MLPEVKAYLAVLAAQRRLHAAARALLRTDKSDGIRAVRWMERHSQVLNEMREDLLYYHGCSESELPAE